MFKRGDLLKRIKSFLLILLTTLLVLTGCNTLVDKNIDNNINQTVSITEDKNYYALEDVVKYIDKFDKLPPNYITKKEAINKGWNNKEGNLWEVLDGYVIGGDRFYNREKKLPEEKNRKYYEADINYNGGHRGPERLIYSNDGLYYYTKDHYKTFDLIEVE